MTQNTQSINDDSVTPTDTSTSDAIHYSFGEIIKSGIFVVDLETKGITPICHSERSEKSLHQSQRDFSNAQVDMLNAHDPKWSPDGKMLAFHSDLHGWFDIGIYDLISKEISWITQNEGDSQLPFFLSPHQLAYTLSKGPVNWIEITNEQEEREKIQLGQGIHNGIKFTSDLKLAGADPAHLPDRQFDIPVLYAQAVG